MEIYTVSMFGHRYIDNYVSLENKLYDLVVDLLRNKEYVEFLIGRNGDFDQLAASVVKKAKRNYRDDNSALVLVLPGETAEYKKDEKLLSEFYDDIEICYESSRAYPKAAITVRNRHMTDRSDLVVFYVTDRSGGSYKTLKYAEETGRQIINLADKE